MRRQLVDQIAPPICAAIDFGVILMPALAVRLASDRGGMGDTGDLDLLAASTILGTLHAVIARSRLRSEERIAVRRADVWIAAVDAPVVLTFAATVLPVAVLWGFADEHASIAHRGYPVVALWAGVQFAAIVLAEVTGRVVFRWLEPHPRAVGRLRHRPFRLTSPSDLVVIEPGPHNELGSAADRLGRGSSGGSRVRPTTPFSTALEALMYAMIGTSKLNFENPEDAAQMANGILSNLSSAPGFVTGSFARSADGNHGRSMVVFDTEEQAKAAAENARANIPADGPVEIVSIEVYEVVAHA